MSEPVSKRARSGEMALNDSVVSMDTSMDE